MNYSEIAHLSQSFSKYNRAYLFGKTFLMLFNKPRWLAWGQNVSKTFNVFIDVCSNSKCLQISNSNKFHSIIGCIWFQQVQPILQTLAISCCCSLMPSDTFPTLADSDLAVMLPKKGTHICPALSF